MRMKTFFQYSLSVVLVFSIGCNLNKSIQPATAKNIVATVNGAILTEDDLYLMLGEAHSAGQSAEARARTLEELVNEELLYQQGLALGLDKDAKYKDIVTTMEMRIREFKRAEIARRVMSTRIASTVDVTYEEARQYYEQNKRTISTDLHLVIQRFSDESSAEDANERFRSGTPFTAAEGVNTRRSNRMAPWDAGFLHWNQIPVEWEKSLYALNKGEISGVLRSKRAGICIIQVIDTKNNPDAGFETMSASIMNRLRDLRVQEAYDRYIRDLRKSATIVQFGKGGQPLEK